MHHHKILRFSFQNMGNKFDASMQVNIYHAMSNTTMYNNINSSTREHSMNPNLVFTRR